MRQLLVNREAAARRLAMHARAERWLKSRGLSLQNGKLQPVSATAATHLPALPPKGIALFEGITEGWLKRRSAAIR